jgi:CRISPR-associated endonuclease/helicase Cas3
MSAEAASDFNSAEWAKLAGLWHDLGKYRQSFQSYIKNNSGYDPEAHIEQNTNKIHSMAGAIHAIQELGAHGQILAYLIAGHHTGLPDWNTSEAGESALAIRLKKAKEENHLEQALQNSPAQITSASEKLHTKPLGGIAGLHLWMRMLFSCLVDADFLDTEAFMSPEKTATRARYPDVSVLKAQFDTYMMDKALKADPSPINTIRADILQACRSAALQKPGLFSLTVPTGGGKTLSAMAFALDHASLYRKRRVIVAIPYTSIIEQTANQYRSIFHDAVVEHHSNLDTETENSKSRLACENWDAPIIVTTNVQLLESLFAARTSRCRKLHNIANSVIVLDEAQLLPPNLLQPVLDVLRLLTEHYGVTLVLSTATQPALGSRKNGHGHITLRGLDNAREIIPDVSGLYAQLERVEVIKPDDLQVRSSWEDIAQQLMQHESVLAIVNTRKDCRTLTDLMPADTIHLSGLMCVEHRSDTIKKIKARLKDKQPIRVISTQLVEAGVDLDFPVVYRALAGLDSIAQAAGRCNREGKLEKGRVVVFVPPKPPPKGMLTFGEQATRSVWHGRTTDLLSHELYQTYFQQYFGATDPDEYGVLPLLTDGAQKCVVQFRSAADQFRMIDDKASRQIFVPYDEEGQKHIDMLKAGLLERYLMRKLQRYCVTVYENDFNQLKNIGAIEMVQMDMWAVCVTNAYDPVRGLLVADDLYSSNPACTVM